MSALVCSRPATSGEALVKKHGDQFTGIKDLHVKLNRSESNVLCVCDEGVQKQGFE